MNPLSAVPRAAKRLATLSVMVLPLALEDEVIVAVIVAWGTVALTEFPAALRPKALKVAPDVDSVKAPGLAKSGITVNPLIATLNLRTSLVTLNPTSILAGNVKVVGAARPRFRIALVIPAVPGVVT